MRVAVWSSFAWASGADAASVIPRALPDVTDRGLADRLALWRDLGERAVYAALPRTGMRGLLPDCGPEALDAATRAEEAVFAPGIGAIAVPRFLGRRCSLDGTGLAWDSFDATPVPVHRLAGVDVAAADRSLRVRVHEAIDALGDGGWSDAWQRGHEDRVELHWSLPSSLPARPRDLIVRAGAVLEVVDLGLEHADGSASAALTDERRAPLLGLRDAATHALEVAVAAIAGYFASQPRRTSS